MAGSGNSNQRVTMAVLGAKMDNMQADVSEIKKDTKLNTEERITSKERWKAHDKEHASLNAKKWVGDIGAGIVGIGAAIAAAVTKSS